MPSLLDKGRMTVMVQPRKRVRNTRGKSELVADGPRIPVDGALQPVREWSTSEEQTFATVGGEQVLDLRRFFAQDWPKQADQNAAVYFDGEEYDVVGAPQHNRMGRRTRHWALTLRLVRNDPDPED